MSPNVQDTAACYRERNIADARMHWILTYDNNSKIRKLYGDRSIRNLTVNYSLQKNRKESELLIR